MTRRARFDAGERALARSPGGPASRATLLPGEPWADRWRAELAALADAERGPWEALLCCAAGATAPRPTPEWTEAGRAAVQGVGADALWDAAATACTRLRSGADEPTEVADGNANLLRGLVRLLMLQPAPELPRLLGELAVTCMATVRERGPRAQKVANACIVGLGALASAPVVTLRSSAVAHLTLARARIRDRATRAALSTALASAAVTAGLVLEELEETGVPDCGFRGGARTFEFQGARLALTVSGLAVVARWSDPHGRALRGAPGHVRARDVEALAEADQVAQDAESILAAASARIAASQSQGRSWSFVTWRERYLEHGLVGALGRQLAWEANGAPFHARDGEPRDADGGPLWFAPGTRVRAGT